MSLFTTPLVISDGTANHSFSFRAQLPDTKSIVGEYIEPAAASSRQSKLIVKHDDSKAVKRRLFSRRVYRDNVSGELKLVTINTTVTYDSSVDNATVLAECKIHQNAISETGFWNNLLLGAI